MTVLLTLTLCSICSGQERHRCMAGADLSSLLRSHEADVFCGISVGKSWSVSAGASIRVPIRNNGRSAAHRDDLLLEDSRFLSESEDLFSARMAAQYWPKAVFDGPLISFGIGTTQSRNVALPLDIGYMCRAGRGLRITVSYDIELADTIRESRIVGKGICISIGYEF